MNERIFELAKQVTDTVEIVNPDTGITHHRVTFDKEKFAELIVRECAEVAHCNFHVDGLTLGGILKEHFGVEE